ncbi:MAG: HAMP domain-containing histidine kinase [candidate division Zixibacteria bacterium]|nr:HAMP domain-containing histidine kinase [candidate division Zixibacteria bacterium]
MHRGALFNRLFIGAIALIISIYLSAPVLAVDSLEIDHNKREELLPYSLESQLVISWKERQLIYRPAQIGVKDPAGIGTHLVYIRNPDRSEDNFTQIGAYSATNGNTVNDQPMQLIVTDFVTFVDSSDSGVCVAGIGYRTDSAFAFELKIGRAPSLLFLATGTDATGDGEWKIGGGIAGRADYDRDGKQEMLIHVNPNRDLAPRILMCIELYPLRIEWQRPWPVAPILMSAISADDNDPGWIFPTQYPSNGFADSLMQDRYSYAVRVDERGEIVWGRYLSQFVQGIAGVQSQDKKSLIFVHSLPAIDYRRHVDSTMLARRLTRIALDGTVDKTCIYNGERNDVIWLADYTGDGIDEIYILSVDGRVQILDTGFVLLAETGPNPIEGFGGNLPSIDGHSEVIALRESDGIGLYDTRLRKLAKWTGNVWMVEPAHVDETGDLAGFLATNITEFALISIHKRPLLDLVAVLYYDYRYYVIAVISSLIIGLLVMGYYRQRVLGQKLQIELAHAELQRTQRQLIEAEKYRQARDIAGGFAHEIRNALFPAEGALKRIKQNLGSTPEDVANTRRLAESSIKAVERAIDMTDLISQYTKLESEIERDQVVVAKVVAESLASNDSRIQEQQITVLTSGSSESALYMNQLHLHMIVNNLLLNALDAVSDQPTKEIRITWEENDDRLTLSCQDTGVGIDPAIRERIFQPFFSTKPNSGTGLGLAIVHRLVTIYQGKITVENGHTQGARLTVMLPHGPLVGQNS